jgi:hypothetical protein
MVLQFKHQWQIQNLSSVSILFSPCWSLNAHLRKTKVENSDNRETLVLGIIFVVGTGRHRKSPPRKVGQLDYFYKPFFRFFYPFVYIAANLDTKAILQITMWQEKKAFGERISKWVSTDCETCDQGLPSGSFHNTDWLEMHWIQTPRKEPKHLYFSQVSQINPIRNVWETQDWMIFKISSILTAFTFH